MSEDDPVVVNDPNDDTNNELPVMTVGKYQMATVRNDSGDDFSLIIMDTETGYVKKYYCNGITSQAFELRTEQQLW